MRVKNFLQKIIFVFKNKFNIEKTALPQALPNRRFGLRGEKVGSVVEPVLIAASERRLEQILLLL